MKVRTLSEKSDGFSSTPTELSDVVFEVASGLQNLALDLSLQNVVVVTSSMVNKSSNVNMVHIMSLIDSLQSRIRDGYSLIDRKVRMCRTDVDYAVEMVDGSSKSVQDIINRGSKHIGERIEYKRLYYNSLQVAFEFRKLVLDFNKLLSVYNWKFGTVIKVRTDCAFYRMSEDILLDPKFDDVR
jgi:hypothetical protein